MTDHTSALKQHRLIATFKTESDFGVEGGEYESTGTTDVQVAIFDGAPSSLTVASALSLVRQRPDDDLLRIRYTYLSHRFVIDGEHIPENTENMCSTVIYPVCWHPNIR